MASWIRLPSRILPDTPSSRDDALLGAMRARLEAYPLRGNEACDGHTQKLLARAFKTRAPWRIGAEIIACVETIYRDAELYDPTEPPALRPLIDTALTRLAPSCIEAADKATHAFLRQFIDSLPPSAFHEKADTELALPLYTLIPQIKFFPGLVYHHFASPVFAGRPLFPSLHATLDENTIRASGFDPKTYDGKRKLTFAHEAEGSVETVLETYLRGTPFLQLLATPVPFSIPRHLYAEHAAVFAPSGHGKTQTLQALIAGFLKEPDPPGMFILDSQGDMLRRIEKLAVFDAALKDRLVILDPEDATPPALNFFHLGTGVAYDAQQHELFNYLFTAIDSELTAKQGTAVTYLLKLMRVIPGATIETLKDLMEAGRDSDLLQHVSKLDRITQDFFANQFLDKSMAPTRTQIARRLYTILGNPTFTRMFAAKENRFNALAALREKKIVLINTSQRFLGQEASAVFGRFIIAQCLAAAYERGPSNDLSLLIVDEASEYFDAKTERILSPGAQVWPRPALRHAIPRTDAPAGESRRQRQHGDQTRWPGRLQRCDDALARDVHHGRLHPLNAQNPERNAVRLLRAEYDTTSRRPLHSLRHA
ncbi:MAG: DUF87 domain-containing protein [Hyphomicrobium sp.]|nr:DUF87 domain-containing protein [Hyphomicrobium sp.]